MARANLIAYAHGEYFNLFKRPKGFFGYSVAREDVIKRRLIDPYKKKTDAKPEKKHPPRRVRRKGVPRA